ncbi:MAG: hypothetical protein MMC33_009576, partial [Icmadophila ericetorum]|nr:hypothetical protein [Icmadophila ericetorum]
MSLETYFSLIGPIIGEAFNIQGLQPVLVERSESGAGDDFLLTDDEDDFYLWNECDGRLWRYKQPITLQEAIAEVTEGVDW